MSQLKCLFQSVTYLIIFYCSVDCQDDNNKYKYANTKYTLETTIGYTKRSKENVFETQVKSLRQNETIETVYKPSTTEKSKTNKKKTLKNKIKNRKGRKKGTAMRQTKIAQRKPQLRKKKTKTVHKENKTNTLKSSAGRRDTHKTTLYPMKDVIRLQKTKQNDKKSTKRTFKVVDVFAFKLSQDIIMAMNTWFAG